ncbi:MAG: glycosyltransferase family A protein [Candidatus Bathyarchaeota archaeon]
MKTIILIPTRNNESLIPSFFIALYNLNPQPEKFIFATNDNEDRTLELLNDFQKPHEIVVIENLDREVEKTVSIYKNIAFIRQVLLNKARFYNPDFAVFIDDDVFIQSPNLLNIFTSRNLDIVGDPYLKMWPEGTYLASRWKHPTDPTLCLLRKIPRKDIEEVEMTSGGCLCLSRKVVQDTRLSFWPMNYILERPETSEDFGYCLTAKKYGYKIWLEGTIQLDHRVYVRGPRSRKPWTVPSQNPQPRLSAPPTITIARELFRRNWTKLKRLGRRE